jgi:hypothetical protein
MTGYKRVGEGGETIVYRSLDNPDEVSKVFWRDTFHNQGPYKDRKVDERIGATVEASKIPGFAPKARKSGGRTVNQQYIDLTKAVDLKAASQMAGRGNVYHFRKILKGLHNLHKKYKTGHFDVRSSNLFNPETTGGFLTLDPTVSGPLTSEADLIVDLKGIRSSLKRYGGEKASRIGDKIISSLYGEPVIEQLNVA